MSILECASVDAAIGDDDAMWNANELCIRELHTGSCITIIEQNLEATLLKLRVKLLGEFRHLCDFAALSGTNTTSNGAIGVGQMIPAAS